MLSDGRGDGPRRKRVFRAFARSVRGTGVLVLGLTLALAVVSAGCGEEVAEKVAEKAAEEAMERSDSEGDGEGDGGEVDIDLDEDEGSVSVSGEDDDSTFEAGTGAGASLPEGFPEDLVPEDSQVLTSITNTESDGTNQLSVSFAVEDGGEDLFNYYVDTLEDAGYTIGTKMQFDSGGGTGFAVEASNEEEQVVVNGEEGGSEEGSTVQVSVQR